MPKYEQITQLCKTPLVIPTFDFINHDNWLVRYVFIITSVFTEISITEVNGSSYPRVEKFRVRNASTLGA